MHTRAHLIRAVLEGVAYSQRECVDVFREMGVPVSNMTVTGGGRSSLWRQMLADLYGCPVNTLQSDEGGALGAALLAGVVAGLYSSVEQEADAVVQKNKPMMPVAANSSAYEPYFDVYKSLYPRLKESFSILAMI